MMGGSGSKGGHSGDERVDVARSCHEIIDAASSLVVNLEILAGKNAANLQILEDARQSIERIVSLARAIQGAPETPPLSHRSAPRS
jgi:hypothetical protein